MSANGDYYLLHIYAAPPVRKMPTSLYLAVLTVAGVVSFCGSVTVDILRPVKSGYEAALLFVPERLVDSSAYKPLGKFLMNFISTVDILK